MGVMPATVIVDHLLGLPFVSSSGLNKLTVDVVVANQITPTPALCFTDSIQAVLKKNKA